MNFLSSLEYLGRRADRCASDRARTAQKRVDEALAAALGIVLIEPADEDHHLAAVGHRIAERLAAHQASLVVVHADVHEPVGFRRIGVVRDEIRFRGGLVDCFDLVLRIDRADRDAIGAAGQQVFDLAGLIGDRSGVMTVTSTLKSLPAVLAPARACSQKSATPLVIKA